MHKLTIHTGRMLPGQIELLRCLLENAGIAGKDIVEETRKKETSLFLYPHTLQHARSLAERIRSCGLKGIQVSLNRLQDADWKTRWKRYLKPFKITSDVYIAPSWKKFTAPRGCRAVLIDTTFAFGTGLHATTQMMAQLIALKKGAFSSLIDIGTGSGILAILARHYGAQTVWAIDNDRQAVETAAKNLKRNRCKADFLGTVDIGTMAKKQRFDFVAANLITDDLIRFKEKLLALVKPGGYLAVSGIFDDNVGRLRKAFRGPDLTCCTELKKKKWHAFLFKRQ